MVANVSVHLIDPDSRRRAAISRLLYSCNLHAEVYEGIWELIDRVPADGVILAHGASDRAMDDSLLGMIKRKARHLPFAMYGSSPTVEQVVQTMRSGAYSYLEWPCDADLVARTIRELEKHGSNERRLAKRVSQAAESIGKLSPREGEVLRALVQGNSNKEIARRLEISPRTVEIHRANMMAKLGAHSSADAVRAGIYAGLDEQPDLHPQPCHLRQISTSH